jgi:ribosomal protein L11 methyltransferase
MKEFLNITFSIPEEYFELAIASLMDFETLGIQEDYDKLIVTFDNKIFSGELVQNLLDALSPVYSEISILKQEVIAAQNWNREWEENVPLVKISERIEILPEWKKHESTAELQIIINPKMSFGTGQHETTRLISKLMEKHCKAGQFWIDAGTGTGVLAILAIKLGVSKVFAFDNNFWSIENANENVILNNVEDKVVVEELDIDQIDLQPADGIVANLFANLLIHNFPKFHKALTNTKGMLLVSGVLKYQQEELIEAAEQNGFKFVEITSEEEWISVAFQSN